jgi:hypothetical protein
MDQSYALRLAQAEALASELLDIRFANNSRNYKTHVGARFIWVARLHNEGDVVGRDAELLKLLFLFKHLAELRRGHREAYRRARRAVRKATNEAQYFGARMEIYAAASLVRAGITFRCRESPDYELLEKYQGCSLECGSGNFQGENRDMINKIGLVVKGKSQKAYAKRGAALFIDITNLVFHGAGQDPRPTTEEVRERVSEEMTVKGFGSVNLFTYGFGTAASSISAQYIRIDSPEAEPALLRFMDEVYPYNQPVAPIGVYPDQG